MTFTVLLAVLGVLIYLVFVTKVLSTTLISIKEIVGAHYSDTLYSVIPIDDVARLKDPAIRNLKEVIRDEKKLLDCDDWMQRPDPGEANEMPWAPSEKTKSAMSDLILSVYFSQFSWLKYCAALGANRQVALGRRSNEETLCELAKIEMPVAFEREIDAAYKLFLRQSMGQEEAKESAIHTRWCLRSWVIVRSKLLDELYPGEDHPGFGWGVIGWGPDDPGGAAISPLLQR